MYYEYDLIKDGNEELSEHFRVREFKCTGTDDIIINKDLVYYLEVIRHHFGKPIYITSAYRTPECNVAVNGSKNSQHLYGNAVDFYIKDIDTTTLYQYCCNLIGSDGGVGKYSTHVHIDLRGKKARWKA